MKKILAISLFMIFLFTACGSPAVNSEGEASSPVYNDIIKISVYEGIQSVDPAYAHNEQEISVINLVYEGLVREVNGAIMPALANKWEVSSDGLTYTFYLNDKVFFHNGKEMTADDVRFSFERVLRQHLAGSYVFANIEGAGQVISGESKELAGLITIGDHILKVNLAVPDKNFLHNLATPTAKVLDRLELVEEGINFGRSSTISQVFPLPSGTGPYRLAEWIGGKQLSLGSFDNYYGEEPYPQRIEYYLDDNEKDALLRLRAGTVSFVWDAFSSSGVLKDESDAFVLISQPVRVFRYLVINPDIEPLNNLQLRKAIFDAISPPEMIEAVRKGYGEQTGNDIAGLWYEPNTQSGVFYEDRTNIAKLELAAAGYPGGVGLPNLTLLCGPTMEDKAAAKYIADSLAVRGVEITIESLSYNDLSHRIREGSAAFYIDEFSDKGGGLDIFFKERVDSAWQNTIKNGSWSEILVQAYSGDAAVKRELFSQVEKNLYNEGILYCLYFNKSIIATTQAFGGLKVSRDGSLDFSQLVKNSRKKE